MLTPLQLPGTTELVIVLLNLVILIALIAGVVYLVRRFSGRGTDGRVEELERRVEELESEFGE